MKRLCIHIEVDIDDAGHPVSGESYACWDNSIQKVSKLKQISGSDHEEETFNAFAGLMDDSFKVISDSLYKNKDKP